MIAGEAACIWAFARSIVQPGFNRPINESHHAVGWGMRFLPGSQKKGSAQSGMATSNLCPISTPKKPGAATPMTEKTLPSSRMVRLVIAGSPLNWLCQKG